MRRNRAESPSKEYVFYCIGVVMAMACIVLAFASNTALGQFRPAHIPLSWMAGFASIVAFLASEYFDTAIAVAPETEYPVELFQEEPEYAG
jgi:hypothetical protein